MSGGAEAEHWAHVKALLTQALELPAQERSAFVARACAGDERLRTELSGLVHEAAWSRSPLDDSPAAPVAEAWDEAGGRSWIGRWLGPYRLIALIGGGGMGRVYLAERADGQYEQRVAVKLLRDDGDHGAFVERFKVERQILASLDHPNLSKILDAGVTVEGVPYFVMELVEGDALDVYCRTGALSVEARLQLVRTVCQVVHYTHQRGVIHRDLKPANILVSRAGQVKLVDFGIAKRLAPDADSGMRTATHERVMTLDYASPEQVRGESVTPASDVFSLGAVLYRLLVGACPYGEESCANGYALAKAICDTEAIPPSRASRSHVLRRRLAGDVDAVILMALRKDPAHRYGSAEQLSDDLFRHLEGLPVQARRGAWSYRTGRFMLRHRVAVSAALAANFALLCALGLAAHEQVRASRQQELAQRHFNSVRRLANVFVVDISRELETVPGTLSARRRLVTTAFDYLQQLSTEAKGDVELELELAAGYRRVGDIQGSGTVASFGDSAAALYSYDAAQRLLADLRTDGGFSRAARAEFVALSASKGALLTALGRYKDAEALELQGLEVARQLLSDLPEDADARRRIGHQLRVLASVYQRSVQGPALDRVTPEGERLLEGLVAAEPDDLESVADLGALHAMRAVHLMQNVNTPTARQQALNEFQTSLGVMGPAYEKQPLNATLSTNFGKISGYMGLLMLQLGRAHEALGPLRRAVGIADLLAAKDPGNARARIEQAEAQGRLADALLALHEPGSALNALRTALGDFESLPPQVQHEVVIEYNIATTHEALGDALRAHSAGATIVQRRAELSEACEHIRTEQALLADNLSRRPDYPLATLAAAKAKEALRRCPRAIGTDAALRSAHAEVSS